MTTFAARALPTGVGSLPHTNPQQALELLLANFGEVPYWPQLPRRDFRENMYAEFGEDLPSVQIDLAHEWMGAVVDDNLLPQIEAFYTRYLTEDLELFSISPEYAAGLYALKEQRERLRQAKWVKGQVTGPISLGLKITDRNLRPILYDDALRDVLVKQIVRKAQWQEKFLAELGQTLIFVDEPSLSLIGASVVALNREDVVRDLEEVFSSMHGLKGTHCCGNTDWSLLLGTSVDVISFDAYNYAENLALFADDVKRFLERGGGLAWGIVPTVQEQIMRETSAHLAQRLEEAVGLLAKKGIDKEMLYERALITPACGLGPLSVRAAERAIALTRETSAIVREAHGLVAG
jgi:methionine synthase II (cobalamin-independent)